MEINRQSCSTHLKAFDIFSCGERVYLNKLQTSQELQNNIPQYIRTLDSEILQPLMKHSLERAKRCEVENVEY